MPARSRGAVLLLALAFVTARAIAQQAAAPQLIVEGAAPDPSGQTLTISGANFGTRPLVTLDLIPLTIQFGMDSRIVASVPVNDMPAGTYLLTVSRGPSPAESGSLSITPGLTGSLHQPLAPPAERSGRVERPGRMSPRKVGDRAIAMADVDREWQRTDPAGYLVLSRQLYEARRRIADQMVADQVLSAEATRRGVTVEALLAEEIPRRTIPLPDTAVAALYQSMGDRTRGASLEQMRPALRAWLARNTEPDLAKMNYVEELMKVSTRAEVVLTPPQISVDHDAGDATLGSATAAVELVAFGDFGSDEYARFGRSLGSVRDMFGDRLRIVFKPLPVTGPDSMGMAEAAACAQAQGKFWPYHDALVTQSGPFGRARLTEIARTAGLTVDAFDTCVDRGQSRAGIRQALAEAARYGITDSPSFLVNGRLAAAAPSFLPPLEFFKRIIEEELQRQTKDAQTPR